MFDTVCQGGAEDPTAHVMWTFATSTKAGSPVASAASIPPRAAEAQKWVESREAIDVSRQLIAYPVDVSSVATNPVSLISIFGRARQGKSFLMNCLAGEKELFAVSNKKDSCTQGIDISSKWLSLEAFSKVDNDAAIKSAPKVRVGFVDAEGQGDKDVEYDAELVCPTLLLSKAVIFNWKGDLQKDHLLQTLGIMCRAAKNVGDESSSSSSQAAKPFGHLHVVFRDWQAVDTSEAEVLDDLLKHENATQRLKPRQKQRLRLRSRQKQRQQQLPRLKPEQRPSSKQRQRPRPKRMPRLRPRPSPRPHLEARQLPPPPLPLRTGTRSTRRQSSESAQGRLPCPRGS